MENVKQIIIENQSRLQFAVVSVHQKLSSF